MDDLSPSKISVDEVHKIAILDIRLMNADRNSANLLCRRRRDNTIELVPIDHGFCLRSVADTSWMDWCWLDWPQLKEVNIIISCVWQFEILSASQPHILFVCSLSFSAHE